MEASEELTLESLAPLLRQHAHQARVQYDAEPVDWKQNAGDEAYDSAN